MKPLCCPRWAWGPSLQPPLHAPLLLSGPTGLPERFHFIFCRASWYQVRTQISCQKSTETMKKNKWNQITKKTCGIPLNIYLISNRRVPFQNPLNIAILLYEFEWTCNLWPMMANVGLHNPHVCFLSMTFKSSSFWLYETVTWLSSAFSKQIIRL